MAWAAPLLAPEIAAGQQDAKEALAAELRIKASHAKELRLDAERRYEARMFRGSRATLPYRLLAPDGWRPEAAGKSAPRATEAKRYPLVLFLHGAGERGDDNAKQLIHGLGEFASDPIRQRHPCFVAAPQCPTNQMWVDTPWQAPKHSMPERPTEVMQSTLELVEHLVEQLPVDQRRVYVTGLSMGGFGVWDAVQRRPNLFAAAAPVCGGGDVALAPQIAKTPVWVFHGEVDSEVMPDRSRHMVAALRKAGGAPRYTEYPRTGHNSWSATYANLEFYDWLFQQRNHRLDATVDE